MDADAFGFAVGVVCIVAIGAILVGSYLLKGNFFD